MTKDSSDQIAAVVSGVIAGRRAVRKYTDQPVPDAVIDQIVHDALEAPTAFNAQRAHLVVVRDQKVKDGLFAASNQPQLRDAPVVLVAVADAFVPEDLEDVLGQERGGWVRGVLESLPEAVLRETAMKDAMLVASFALVSAAAHGLGTSPTTGWDEKKVLSAIGLDDATDRSVGLVIAMGYPDEKPAHPGRVADRRVDDSF